MAHANFISYGLSPLPRPQAGIESPAKVAKIPDASGKRIAWIFCAPESRTVSHLGFQLAGVGDAGDKKFRISLQEIDANGRPNGTIVTSGTFLPNPDNLTANDFNWISVTPEAEINAGTIYAIALEYDDTPPTVTGITVTRARWDFISNSNPYYAWGSATSWGGGGTVNLRDYPTAAAFRYSGQTAPLAFGNPFTTTAPVNGMDKFVTSNVGERVAMRFKIPSGMGTTFKVAGIRIWASAIADAQAGKIMMGLWKHPNSLVQNKVLYPGSFGNGAWRYWELFFGESCAGSSSSSSTSSGPPSPTKLYYDTVYYVGFEQSPQNRGHDALPARLDLVTVREYDAVHYPYHDIEAYPGGADVFAARFEQVNSVWQWTEIKNSRPMIDLILSDITGS